MPIREAGNHVRVEALPQRRRHRLASEDVRHSHEGSLQVPGVPSMPAARPSILPRVLTGLQILVVDDDPDILELFSAALRACGGEVVAADNASDALALAMRTRPHVIVSDIAMVGEDGYWLIERLRRLPPEVLPGIPVIAATAYGREHSRARVLAAGFTEHLQKPVDPEHLCRIVAKVAGR